MQTVIDLVNEAKASIDNLSTRQVAEELSSGSVVLVDLREPTETATGVIPGAILAPRGMLEYYCDPTTPYHLEQFDPQAQTILYCASGGRSALATRTLEQMGYENVAHIDGGFKAWVAEDRPVMLPDETDRTVDRVQVHAGVGRRVRPAAAGEKNPVTTLAASGS